MAARALREHGTIPPAADDPTVYLKIRSGERLLREKRLASCLRRRHEGRRPARDLSASGGVEA